MTMTRRNFLQTGALAVPLAASPVAANFSATVMIESTHPRIVALAKDITQSASTDRAASA